MGSWKCSGPDGEVSLVFETGNRLVFGGEPSTYTLVAGAVRILDEGVHADYRYTLKGDSPSFISRRTNCTSARGWDARQPESPMDPPETRR